MALDKNGQPVQVAEADNASYMTAERERPAVVSNFKHIQNRQGLDGSPSGCSIILPLVNSIKRFHA